MLLHTGLSAALLTGLIVPLARAADSTPTTPTAPPTYTVAKGSLTFEIKTDGVFQAADCMELKTQFKSYAGPLTIVSIVPQGKMVHKGDLLLSLDTTAINWNLASAESDLAAAKASLAKTESDVEVGAKMDALSLKNQEDAVRNAEMGKQWWDQLDGPHMLQSADLTVKQAKASVDDQNDELDQLRKMYKSDELTSATADIVVKRAVRQLEQSQVGLKMQEDRREKVKTFDYTITKQRVIDAIDGAKQQLELLKSSLAQTAVNRRSAVTSSRIAFEQTTKRLADLKDDFANFAVKATCDGMVEYGSVTDSTWNGGDAKSLRPGERIGAGQVILRVFEPGKAFWVEPAMKAKVTPAACPQISYRAKCGPVDIVPRGSPPTIGFQVSIDLGHADKRLLPGMKASVAIDAGKLNDVLIVPVGAVTAGKVQIKGKEGKTRAHSVTVGRSDGQSVEIKSGLSEGDEIILPGKK
jgi:hypothetical protein